jgi:hypothetical protein
MKKIIIGLLMMVLMIQLVNAAEVCVVADYGNGEADSECVEIDEDKSGYELIEEMGWDLLWSPASAYGRMICKINDEGTDVSGQYCEYNGDFWNLVLNRDGEWLHLPIGLDASGGCWNYDMNSWSGHYCTKDGDVLGLAFGAAGAEPEMFKVNVSKIYIDGEKQRESKTKGGKIVDVFPESKIKIKIELENMYKHSTDIDINDISIEGTIEEIEDGDDIDEELNEFDLEADKKTTKDLEFIIPLEVKAKDRLLKIEIKAEDDAGIKYEQEFTFDMEVEKENHKLKVIDVELNKETYKCGQNALLHFSLLNIGAKDEDVRLNVVNDDLGLNIVESFELSNDVYDESSSYEKRFNIWLPDDSKIDVYPITITADYDEQETETVDLNIGACDGQVAVDTLVDEGVVDVHAGDSDEHSHQPFGVQSEVIEEDTTVMELTITNNLPLILTGVLIVIIIIIVALGIGFFVLRK